MDEKQAIRLIKKMEKDAAKSAKKKVPKSEADLVRDYAKVIVAKQQTRGMVSEKFKNLQPNTKPNKDLWMDWDFYFSVVFESRSQKVQFLEFLAKKIGVEPDSMFDSLTTQIINGMELARRMGCDLKKEIAKDFPLGNMDIKEFILDDEQWE